MRKLKADSTVAVAPAIPQRSGRPRDEARSQALHEAALELLSEIGFERMTMEAVAARAGTSKATAYRRWCSKAALVVDALRCHGPEDFDPPDTGSLRGDLVAVLHHMRSAMEQEGAARLIGLVASARSDPDLAAAMRADFTGHRQRISRTLAGRAVARGEMSPEVDPDVFHEVIPPMLLNRMLMSDEPLTDAFLAHVVDDVALPVLTSGTTPQTNSTIPTHACTPSGDL